MADTRSLSAANATPLPLHRNRLRSVSRDEVVQVADLLQPGATWLPAPQHTVPAVPGRPPMIGYLVLLPAGTGPVARCPTPGPRSANRYRSTVPGAPPRWTGARWT